MARNPSSTLQIKGSTAKKIAIAAAAAVAVGVTVHALRKAARDAAIAAALGAGTLAVRKGMKGAQGRKPTRGRGQPARAAR